MAEKTITYLFGPFILGDDLRRKDGREVRIGWKAFQLLRYLVEHAGQAISQDELLDVVWKDEVVGPGVIHQALHQLRRALVDDNGKRFNYIEPIIGKRLRFREPVTQKGIDVSAPTELGVVGDHWKVEDLLFTATAANGLYYEIYKLRHQDKENYWGRGKRYRLDFLLPEIQERAKYYARRHEETVGQIRSYSHILNYRDSFFANGQKEWWAVDDWIEGETLETVLTSGKLPTQLLETVMLGVAEGLKGIHAVGIVRRELTPRFITLRHPDRTPILTDFEMAKFLDGRPSVYQSLAQRQNTWANNPYLAPEVEGAMSSELDIKADLYSWATILVHAATGKKASKPREWVALLQHANLHRKVIQVTRRCLADIRDNRPESFDEVTDALDRSPLRWIKQIKRRGKSLLSRGSQKT